MNDIVIVRKLKSCAKFTDDEELLRQGQRRSRRQPRSKVLSSEKLCNGVGNPCILSEVKNRDDIRVLEARCAICFLEKSRTRLLRVLLRREVGGHDLDRDFPIEHGIHTSVEDTQHVTADALEDSISSDGLLFSAHRSRPGNIFAGAIRHGVNRTPRQFTLSRSSLRDRTSVLAVGQSFCGALGQERNEAFQFAANSYCLSARSRSPACSILSASWRTRFTWVLIASPIRWM